MTGPLLSLLVLLTTTPQPGTIAAAGNVIQSTPPAAAAKAPTQADVERLQAQAFELRVRLAEADQQAGLEKAKRAALELDRLKQEVNGLPPAVKALLGLTVADRAPGPAPPPEATKDAAPPAGATKKN